MRQSIAFITGLCLLLPLALIAEPVSYQTASKPEISRPPASWKTPLLAIDPDTGKVRVYIQPDASFSNAMASSDAPVYHAQALYEPTQQGISSSQLTLHRQMRNACPQGWIKLQEWVQLNTDRATLNYQFQCLSFSTPASEPATE